MAQTRGCPHFLQEDGITGAPQGSCGALATSPQHPQQLQELPKALVRGGAGCGWVAPEHALGGHLSGVCAGDKWRTELGTSGRDPGQTGTLAHLLDGDLLRHIVYHTHHICLQGREHGTALPEASCPHHPSTHRQGRAGQGTEARKPPLTGAPQPVLFDHVSGAGGLLCKAHTSPSLLASRSQHYTFGP